MSLTAEKRPESVTVEPEIRLFHLGPNQRASRAMIPEFPTGLTQS